MSHMLALVFLQGSYDGNWSAELWLVTKLKAEPANSLPGICRKVPALGYTAF